MKSRTNGPNDSANFEREATTLNTLAEQDGEIFDEDWSLDAAIAARELHDLRNKEQQAIEAFDIEEAELTRAKLEATTQRTTLIETLAAYNFERPESDTTPPPENNVRKKHKKPSMMQWICN